jgi:hypothetical protein
MPINRTITVHDRGGELVTIVLAHITCLGWSTGPASKPHGGTVHLINGAVIHLAADAPGESTIADIQDALNQE